MASSSSRDSKQQQQQSKRNVTTSGDSKSIIFEKALFESLISSQKSTAADLFKQQQQQHQRSSQLRLDESQLKNIGKIVSNLPFEIIKRSYDETLSQSNNKNRREGIGSGGGELKRELTRSSSGSVRARSSSFTTKKQPSLSFDEETTLIPNNSSNVLQEKLLSSSQSSFAAQNTNANNNNNKNSNLDDESDPQQQRFKIQSNSSSKSSAVRRLSDSSMRADSRPSTNTTTNNNNNNNNNNDNNNHRQSSSLSASNFTSNIIVIHVCDENKNLKQDFTCPRDLLVKEMKYFSHNLGNGIINSKSSSSSNSANLAKKTLDEIDISVHCDINIFDWLMRYVKRNHPSLIDSSSVPIKISNTTAAATAAVIQEPGGGGIGGEPKLEIKNCVSILLSSDFLIMGDLVDKCVIFIVENIESILQVSSVMSGIKEALVYKMAACISINKLDELYDRKDKIKTKLFQRKVEFMFNADKLNEQFRNSPILDEWKNNNDLESLIKAQMANLKEAIISAADSEAAAAAAASTVSKTIKSNSTNSTASSNGGVSSSTRVLSLLAATDTNHLLVTNYVNYLFELENDASTLFRCKLCSCLMTKRQSMKLKCHLGILNAHGDYVYLHMPDDKFDLNSLLQLLKEKCKSSWRCIYWYLWALTKSCVCKKCGKWFRLVDLNKCRLNDNTFCQAHDTKNATTNATGTITTNTKTFFNNNASAAELNNYCTCIYCDHVLDLASIFSMHADSPLAHSRLVGSFEIVETRLSKYSQYIVNNLEKHKGLICRGGCGDETQDDESSDANANMSFTNIIESLLQSEAQSSSKQQQQAHNINHKQQQLQQSSAGGSSTGVAGTKLFNSPAKNNQMAHKPQMPASYFVDSITGKHIFLLDKNMINLIKLSLAHLMISSNENSQQPLQQQQQQNQNNIQILNHLPAMQLSFAATTTTSATAAAANSFSTASAPAVGGGSSMTSSLTNTQTQLQQNHQQMNAMNTLISSIQSLNLDIYALLNLIGYIDPQNFFNSMDVLQFLKVDPKMRWDLSKPVRLNQDNQREDDLKRFREISSYLIKAKLLSEYFKPADEQSSKSAIATVLVNSGGYVSNPSTTNAFVGGIYQRIEHEWRYSK